MAKRIYSGCKKIIVNRYKSSKHIIVKKNILSEINKLDKELKKQGLKLDYCALILMGIDAYRSTYCS